MLLIVRHTLGTAAGVSVGLKSSLTPCCRRFQHSQFVEGEPHVRFYSGAPLVSSEGYVMGSLGILDLVPRK